MTTVSNLKSSTGQASTQGLFYEWNNPDAPFSLRDTGTLVVGETYPNDIWRSWERFNFNLEVTDTLPPLIQY